MRLSSSMSMGGLAPGIPPAIQGGPALPAATVGRFYSFQFTASGGTAPYQSWSATPLPAWASLDPNTGILSGTPTAVESDSFTVRMTDFYMVPATPVAFTLQVTAAPTFDFYISPTGNDANAGTLAAPWAITAINSHAPGGAFAATPYAGKNVGLLAGTYPLNALVNATAANGIALQVAPGTVANPTLIGAVTPRAAILDAHQTPGTTGSGYPTALADIIGAPVQATMGNTIIDGLTITGGSASGVHFFGAVNTATPGTGATGFVVRNCEIYDFSGQAGNNIGAVIWDSVTGGLVSNCLLHDIGFSSGTVHHANASGVHSWRSRSNIYESNTIYNTGSGIHEKTAALPGNGNGTARYNYTVLPLDSDGWCINLGPGVAGDVVTCHHNICAVHTAGTSGPTWITLLEASTTVYMGSPVVYNNTCYAVSSTATDIGGMAMYSNGTHSSPPGRLTHYNNIYLYGGTNTPSSTMMDIGFDAGNASQCLNLSDFNYYVVPTTGRTFIRYRDPVTFGVGASQTLATWRANGSPGFDNSSVEVLSSSVPFGSVVVTPNFDPTSPQGFKLAGGSPCIGFGRVGGVAAGAAVDAGAWGGSPAPTQIGANFVQITTAALPAATVGTAYSFALAATGGSGSYTWLPLDANTFPNWMNWLSCSALGVLTGTPPMVETETVFLQVQDTVTSKISHLTLSLTVQHQ